MLEVLKNTNYINNFVSVSVFIHQRVTTAKSSWNVNRGLQESENFM